MLKRLRDKNFIIILPFVLLLCLVPAAGFLCPDHLVSETENRSLAQFPVMDLRHFSDTAGSIETYVTEQFPQREALLKAYTMLELAQGKKMIRGTFVAQNEWLLPRQFKTTPEEALTFAASLGDFAQSHPDIPVVFAILPHKTTLLAPLETQYISQADSMAHYEALLAQLPKFPQLYVIDTAAEFLRLPLSAREAFYFKGDFHWNARGAFFAAGIIEDGLQANGFLQPSELFSDDDFVFDELDGVSYQGDLNRRFSDLVSGNEVIPLIHPKETAQITYYRSVDDQKPVTRGALIGTGLDPAPGADTASEPEAAVSYNDIYTENLGYYRVENPQSKSDQSILIFKDSLQNPTTDFFSVIFRSVDVIDARYYDEPYSADELIGVRKPDLILIMLHHDNYSPELMELLGG